ncbi:something about silencing protein 10 [Lingula anatina]|uniref:Something about silencing protein 10 n=1 Tax=Lingula anatina TaxID=7574 RepID=A0A1S3K1V8_LINAN|nr:something about silencing protein 10 [Lingula anatina]|eukprot:XP_013416384.1 something about silencing protein 10 [Lingula anatina]
MGKAKRVKKAVPAAKRRSLPTEDFDTDLPDPKSQDFFNDEIDDFHASRDKIPLGSHMMEPAGFSSDEEEVLPVESDYDEEDEDQEEEGYEEAEGADDSADSAKDGEDDLDEKAWGRKKSKFYGADVEDVDIDLSGSEEGDAELEEKEALALQKKMAEQLSEEDFGFELFQDTKKSKQVEDTEQEKIHTDLSSLSKKKKMELLKKESPELIELIDDFKLKLTEVKERIEPMFKLVRDGSIPPGGAADYIETKMRLYLSYCLNVQFYLILKARRTPVQNHPVIGRLVQYRNLIKDLLPVDEQLQFQIDDILERVKKGEVIRPQQAEGKKRVMLDRKRKLPKTKKTGVEKKKLSQLMDDEEEEEEESDSNENKSKKKKGEERFETKDEKEALEFYQMMKEGRRQVADGQEEEESDQEGQFDEGEEETGAEDLADEGGEIEDEEDGGKRGINYQIEKNKGLTPHRKKELKNPRVKHRKKYRKAKIRRKGQIREARTEMKRYGGEISGIRAGIIRGVKLKA